MRRLRAMGIRESIQTYSNHRKSSQGIRRGRWVCATSATPCHGVCPRLLCLGYVVAAWAAVIDEAFAGDGHTGVYTDPITSSQDCPRGFVEGGGCARLLSRL
jgi:hypothetical protein